MHIHFVCTGNAYRSRLAEAYLKSKQIPNIIVTSSGTEAEKHALHIGPISWEAMRLLKQNHLIPFMKLASEKTTPDALKQADILIFFEEEHKIFAETMVPLQNKMYHIWEIPDIVGTDIAGNDMQRIQASEKTFAMIQQKVDELSNILRSASPN